MRQELLDRLRVSYQGLHDITTFEAYDYLTTPADMDQLRMAEAAVLRAILSIRARGGEAAQARPAPST